MLAVTGLDRGYDEPLTVAMLLEANIHTTGMAVVLVAMTKERAERDLERSSADAYSAVGSRARFVAHMSHEVRTSLNGVLGVAQLLLGDPTLSADQRQLVEMLRAAGGHLLAIVNEALDMAKIDAGRLQIVWAPLDPREVAEGCLGLVRPSAIETRLALDLQVAESMPAVVLGDVTRLCADSAELGLERREVHPSRGFDHATHVPRRWTAFRDGR